MTDLLNSVVGLLAKRGDVHIHREGDRVFVACDGKSLGLLDPAEDGGVVLTRHSYPPTVYADANDVVRLLTELVRPNTASGMSQNDLLVAARTKWPRLTWYTSTGGRVMCDELPHIQASVNDDENPMALLGHELAHVRAKALRTAWLCEAVVAL